MKQIDMKSIGKNKKIIKYFCLISSIKKSLVILKTEYNQTVGLSNICYTILYKFFQDSLWRFPGQRPHGELIIVPAVIDLELLRKVLE